MAGIIRSKLVAIGNSSGVRLPKAVLEQSGINDEVDIIVLPHQVIIRAVNRPRANWDKQFTSTQKHPTELDQSQWQW